MAPVRRLNLQRQAPTLAATLVFASCSTRHAMNKHANSFHHALRSPGHPLATYDHFAAGQYDRHRGRHRPVPGHRRRKRAAALSVEENGADIPRATKASYTTPPVTLDDNGSLFSVIVTNSAGSVTSGDAVLTVN